MRANRAYELLVHRQGRFFRPSDKLEQVDVKPGPGGVPLVAGCP